MSRIIASEPRSISSHGPTVGFIRDGGDAVRPEWWRWLTLRGEKVHQIGNVCETCDFFFERAGGDHRPVEVPQVTAALAEGLRCLEPLAADLFSELLPSGDYEVLLLESTVEDAILGGPRDYFTHEQVEAWGIDDVVGKPHDPKTHYYRAASLQLGDRRRLFEFVVPLVRREQLDQERVSFYEQRLAAGLRPTAVAISVLDVKAPCEALDGGESEMHDCFAHYLLDGHHKIEAAARARKPVSILSFLAKGQSICIDEDIQTLMAVFKGD